LQYVATSQPADGPRYLLGQIDQDVWSLTFRVNLAVTPELTIQYYGSPFLGTGRYTDFKRAAETLDPDYDTRFLRFAPNEIAYDPTSNRYRVTEDPGGISYDFANPDFSFRQFRSNLVVRWEYKPGSSLYVVWSQRRTDSAPGWDDAFGSNWRELWRARPDNVLLVKLSYWFSL
jgi:hypothetical protein